VITIAETGEFIKKAKKLLAEGERQELVSYLSTHPTAGIVMEGTGGIRKMRWSRQGMGKSGGVRVIYFFHNKDMPLYALTLYGKSEKDNLSKEERNELGKLVTLLVEYWRSR